MMKKKWPIIMMAGLMALSMGACGNPEPDGGDPADPNAKVTIEFYGWGDTKEIENYNALVNQFMEENPNIIVRYTADNANAYMTTLQNRANNLPDLFYMPDYEFLFWASSGVLKDISSMISEDELSQLWPHAVDEYYYNSATKQLGKSTGAGLYGLPKDLGPFTLVYNKTLVDSQITKLGLNKDDIYSYLNPTDPMTWQEFRTLLKALDPNPSDNLYGISHYEMQPAIYSNNANYFNDDASEQRITDKNFTDALQFIADLTLVDHVMPTAADQVSTDGYTRFRNQGCIFSFMGPWDCAAFWEEVPFEFDILPVAYNGENPDAQSTAWVGSMGYCIDAKTSEAKAQAALKLAKYLCYNEDAQRKFYELGQQVPNIISMATGEYLDENNATFTDKKGPANRSVWVDTINGTSETDKIGGKVRAHYYTYQSLWLDDFNTYINNVGMWTGKVTAAEACANYANSLQAALDKMQADLG